MGVAVVGVGFPVVVQGEVEHLQRRAKGNWTVLISYAGIHGIAPDTVITILNRIPTEVVITHMGELVAMWLGV